MKKPKHECEECGCEMELVECICQKCGKSFKRKRGESEDDFYTRAVNHEAKCPVKFRRVAQTG